jgi:hypothetical protein
MDFFGLIDAIRSYCSDNNISFLYGNDAYSNALIDSSTYDTPLILIADFTVQPTITAGTVVECNYSGVMSLGQKTDDITTSNLDETPIQKYDNRLKYLTTQLATVIGEISCENELEVSGLNIKMDLNKFDLNADFVATPITFNH